MNISSTDVRDMPYEDGIQQPWWTTWKQGAVEEPADAI